MPPLEGNEEVKEGEGWIYEGWKNLTPKDVDENLKHEIEFIIKSNESLEEKKKTRLNNYC